MKKLYADQRDTVLTDVKSDEFDIARGTKQGDPFEQPSIQFGSPITNGEVAWVSWIEQGLGIQIGR